MNKLKQWHPEDEDMMNEDVNLAELQETISTDVSESLKSYFYFNG
jgi:hypothetical protein